MKDQKGRIINEYKNWFTEKKNKISSVNFSWGRHKHKKIF